LGAAFGPGVAAATGAAGSTTTTAATSNTLTPPSQIDSTEAQVAAIATQVSQEQAVLALADERYNEAVVNLTATQASLQTTAATISAAKTRIVGERTQLRNDALTAYMEGTSASAVAAVFAAPTTAAQIRKLYQALGPANVAADVATLNASQRELTATQAALLAEQQAQTTQLAVESQTRATAAAASAQSEATLAQVTGVLAQEVAQQVALQAGDPTSAHAGGSAPGTGGSSGGGPATISGGGPPQTAGLAAVRGAVRYLGVPYQYGGMSYEGVDCSGLTALAWAQAGVSLPHSAADQYSMSRHVSMSALEPGDLLFYKFAGSPIIDHVVMYVGPSLNGQATAFGSNTIIQAAHTGTVVSFDPFWSGGLVGAARP
jgi:cell wall-associated NlpC family hydrolase